MNKFFVYSGLSLGLVGGLLYDEVKGASAAHLDSLIRHQEILPCEEDRLQCDVHASEIMLMYSVSGGVVGVTLGGLAALVFSRYRNAPTPSEKYVK